MANEPDIIQRVTVNTNPDGKLPADIRGTTQSINAEADIVQTLSATFNVVNDQSINFDTISQTLDAQFGTIYVVSGNSKVLYATTATWNSQPTLESIRGCIYIYSDHKQNTQGQNLAGFKVGDGSAYLIDLPFVDEQIEEHIMNTVVHITQEEREKWNNKVRCYMSEVKDDILIFTTN